MRTQIYKQYQGPWASLPFPGGGTNVKGAGCGLCSVTHVIIEDDRYKNYTPEDVQPYMIKWAVRDAGLIHDGIPDSLRHYGMENVREFGRAATMNDIFTELNKGNRKGVILFYKCNSHGATIASVGPDGTCWTGGGHFIGFADYKVEGGKHWFYMKDSGSRNHDGWYSYENSMRGCVWKVWTCTIPGKKEEPKKEEPKKTETKVIDVSYVQNSIDWNKVKADGVDGAMIRCGYRGYVSGTLQEDTNFVKHVKGAVKAGLKVGVYFFTEAINAAEGKEEAMFALRLIRREGLKLSYPVAVDTESINAANVRANNISKEARTEAIKAFCDAVKAGGYEPMIYASTSWLDNKLIMSKLPYKVWVAQYNDKVTYKGSYVMWQYTSTGKVSGISGVVDLNRCYITGSKKTDPAPAPAKKDPIKAEPLVVDGVVGSETVRLAQRVFGTPVDGIISGQAEVDMKHCPGINMDCVKIGKGGSQLVRALQKKVGVTQDGYLGVKTIKAVQKWLNIPVDGYWGSHTSRSFQLWLNKQIQPPSPKQLTTFQKNVLSFAKSLEGIYNYVVFTDEEATHECPFCNGFTGRLFGGNCIKYAWGLWRHCGRIPCRCDAEVINDNCGNRLLRMSEKDMIATIKQKSRLKDIKVIRNLSGIPVGQIEPADILIYYEGDEYVHTACAAENGTITDCSRGHMPRCKYGEPYNYQRGVVCKIAIRYTGK